MLYRPTPVEVASYCWPNLRPNDPWRRFYLEARHLVGLADERFAFAFARGWSIIDDVQRRSAHPRAAPRA